MTDQQILNEIQLALLEPPDNGASWPSEAWTRAEVLSAVNDSIQKLMRETSLYVTRVEIPVLANATSVALPAAWMATATIVWRDTATGARTLLGPVDAFEGDLALPSWETVPGAPVAYADLDQTTLTFRLVPTPLAAGVVELLYVARPTVMTGEGLTLPMPDEFASGEKYAALSLLLNKVGRLQDPERVAYCDRRYQLTQLAAEIMLGGYA